MPNIPGADDKIWQNSRNSIPQNFAHQTRRMNKLIARNIGFAKPLSIEKDAHGNKPLQLSFRFV